MIEELKILGLDFIPNATIATNSIPILANNWWNIKPTPTDPWKGSLGYIQWHDNATRNQQTNTVFSHPMWSARAFFRVMQKYNERGLNTIRKISMEYAPTSDGNDSDLWIKVVMEFMQAVPYSLNLDTKLDLLNKSSLIGRDFARSVTQIEVFKGFSVEAGIVENGWRLWQKDFS